MSWVDIGDQLKAKAYKDFKVGQILTFNYEGSLTHFKIKRIDKQRKKFWVEAIQMYTPQEFTDFWEEERIKRGGKK